MRIIHEDLIKRLAEVLFTEGEDFYVCRAEKSAFVVLTYETMKQIAALKEKIDQLDLERFEKEIKDDDVGIAY